MRHVPLSPVSVLLAAICMSLLSGMTAAHAADAECAFNADKSVLALTVANTDTLADLNTVSYACTASCQYTVTGQRALQTFGCNYSLAPNAPARIACDLAGAGPDHFATLRPTKMVCQPR